MCDSVGMRTFIRRVWFRKQEVCEQMGHCQIKLLKKVFLKNIFKIYKFLDNVFQLFEQLLNYSFIKSVYMKGFKSKIQFTFICVALSTIHFVSKQLHREWMSPLEQSVIRGEWVQIVSFQKCTYTKITHLANNDAIVFHFN